MSQVLKKIYEIKQPEDALVLDAGHAHLAHLVAQEKYEGLLVGKVHDIHCNDTDFCDVPTGSLGLGICIALGMALTGRTVYCVLSDGGCDEGSVWEALRVKTDLKLNNLKVYVNSNGWNALGKVNRNLLEKRLKAFDPTIDFIRTKSDFKHKGVDAHYQKL